MVSNNQIQTQISQDVNQAQWEAIVHGGSHLLIIAGPGTGKTHTLTYRIAHTMKHLNHDQKILAITFTTKAAEEMKERLHHNHHCSFDHMFVGTFHGFCLSLLKTYVNQTNLPTKFTVARPDEIVALSEELWPNLKKSQRLNKLEDISKCKSHNREEDQAEVIAFNQFLRQKGFVDYDDLLCEAMTLLQNRSICAEVQNQFPYLFVDEYQDINPAQHLLLRKLVGENVLITAIGDPNQAIYGFRGANVQFFEEFPHDFVGTKILSLSENFRCAPNIVEACTQVIAKSSLDVPELTANIYSQGLMTVYEAPTPKAEAEYVVHQIEQLIGGTSMFSQDSNRVESDQNAEYSFGDIAVLYRLNAQSSILEEAFHRSGIPYAISGKKLVQDEDFLAIDSEKVNLMTIHAAKGLEFSIVFLVGCEDNLLPLNIKGMASDNEEERRLFYVAMTRAKQRLYFTRAKKRTLYGTLAETKASLFLLDIKESLKNYEKAKVKRKSVKDLEREKQFNLFKI